MGGRHGCSVEDASAGNSMLQGKSSQCEDQLWGKVGHVGQKVNMIMNQLGIFTYL